jgi:phosphoribosylanthranilate isomerase
MDGGRTAGEASGRAVASGTDGDVEGAGAQTDRPDRAAGARVKICGARTPSDVRTVAAAGADAVGVIVDVPVDTPREVSRERARELIAAAPPFLTTVVVTIADDPEAVRDLAAAVGPDAVQVHGHESFGVEATAALRRDLPAALLAVVDADEGADLAAAYDEAEAVDAVLVDSLDDARAGGTGRTHDWPASRRLVERLATPVILAGGLTPDNVAEAVAAVGPFAVDVASGVEPADPPAPPADLKDPDLVRAFVAAAGRGLPGSALGGTSDGTTRSDGKRGTAGDGDPATAADGGAGQ